MNQTPFSFQDLRFAQTVERRHRDITVSLFLNEVLLLLAIIYMQQIRELQTNTCMCMSVYVCASFIWVLCVCVLERISTNLSLHEHYSIVLPPIVKPRSFPLSWKPNSCPPSSMWQMIDSSPRFHVFEVMFPRLITSNKKSFCFCRSSEACRKLIWKHHIYISHRHTSRLHSLEVLSLVGKSALTFGDMP